jgi:hypothetical protein
MSVATSMPEPASSTKKKRLASWRTPLEDAFVQRRHGLRDDSLNATARGCAIVANIAPAADVTIQRRYPGAAREQRTAEQLDRLLTG